MQETVQVAFQVPIHIGEVDVGSLAPIDGVHDVLSQNEWYDGM